MGESEDDSNGIPQFYTEVIEFLSEFCMLLGCDVKKFYI